MKVESLQSNAHIILWRIILRLRRQRNGKKQFWGSKFALKGKNSYHRCHEAIIRRKDESYQKDQMNCVRVRDFSPSL